jgi:Flp pilus assembly protein TadG
MTAARRKMLRGQSLVEVAISLPVLLLLALGVTDIGRAFYYREAVTNSARQALRMAVSPTQQSTADAVCAGAGGPSAVTVTTSIPPGGSSIGTISNSASLESSSNGTPAGSVRSNGAGPLDPGSDSVTVTVTYRLSVITPLLWPVTGTSFPMTATSYQRSEY